MTLIGSSVRDGCALTLLWLPSCQWAIGYFLHLLLDEFSTPLSELKSGMRDGDLIQWWSADSPTA